MLGKRMFKMVHVKFLILNEEFLAWQIYIVIKLSIINVFYDIIIRILNIQIAYLNETEFPDEFGINEFQFDKFIKKNIIKLRYILQ